MLQLHPNAQLTKKEAKTLLGIFYKTVLSKDSIKNPYDYEYDLTKTVRPTWACYWNKIKYRDKPAKIVAKDDCMAIVQFKDDNPKDGFYCFYRLEDLTSK